MLRYCINSRPMFCLFAGEQNIDVKFFTYVNVDDVYIYGFRADESVVCLLF